MKRLAYIFLAFAATAALSSCKDEVLYEPGPQAEGPQYYFSTGTPTSVNINQKTQSVTLDVYRVETASASSLTIGVADESGLISAGSTATANFNAGSNKATVSFPIDPTKWTFAKKYPVTYTISNDTTPYGASTVSVTYTYPTPVTSWWESSLASTLTPSRAPAMITKDRWPHSAAFSQKTCSNSNNSPKAPRRQVSMIRRS